MIESDTRVTNEEGEVWYRITYAGTSGYIREDMVTVVDVPVETPTEENLEENTEEAGAVEEQTQEVTTASTEMTSTPGVTTIDNQAEADDYSSPVASGDSGSLLSGQTEVPSRRGFDIILLLFGVVALLFFSLAFFTYSKMRLEYRRLRGHILKNRVQKADKN